MAAFGAGADSMLDVSVEFRAMSFAMGGGDGDWRECLTLPNILSQFNPSLRGASTANTSAGLFQVSGYNLAVSGATSHSLADQAWSLVRRMRADPWVDLHSDWKMVTVIIGHNDLCRLPCNYKDPAGTATTFLQDWITGSRGMDTTGRFRPGNGGPPLYVQNIRRALDVLHANLPRTFVNLVPITDVAMSLGLVDKPRVCQLTHFNECPCLFDEGIFTTGRISGDEARALTEGYRLGLEQLVASGRYDTRQDFTVVIQPALMDAALPKVFRPAFGRLLPDISFLAPDCFHFSQALHALMARSVWNNLLQPVGRKTTSWEKDVPFLCPSVARPFLATAGQVAAGEAAMESIAQDWRAARALHLVGDCSL
jgi:phospholipase B1